MFWVLISISNIVMIFFWYKNRSNVVDDDDLFNIHFKPESRITDSFCLLLISNLMMMIFYHYEDTVVRTKKYRTKLDRIFFVCFSTIQIKSNQWHFMMMKMIWFEAKNILTFFCFAFRLFEYQNLLNVFSCHLFSEMLNN